MLYETHSHTPLCRHAKGLPREYAAVAHERGLTGLIVTCHSPFPTPGGGMKHSELGEYLEMIDAAAQEWAGRVEVLAGLESDYRPGMEPWFEKLHQEAPFHYILGSVHPFATPFYEQYFAGDDDDYRRLYFDFLAQAAETGLYDSLAHPDLIKNYHHQSWDYDRMLDPMRRALDRIAATGVAMELNTSGLNKAYPEMNPGPKMLREICERGIPMTLGADAHVPERTGENFRQALELLQEAGFTDVHRFYQRKPIAIPIKEALDSLA